MKDLAIPNEALPELSRPYIIAAILDASGSMQPLIDDTVGGYNHFIDEQKQQPDAAIHYLTTFDTIFQHRLDGVKLCDVPALTRGTYFGGHGGSTALLDTVGSGVQALRAAHPGKQRGVILVITDGCENASIQFTKEQVRTQIEAAKVDGWEFVFLGADDTKWAEEGAGLSASVSASYHRSSTGTKHAYSTVSANIAHMRMTEAPAEDLQWSTDEDGPVPRPAGA